ncbi:eukaryotic translation initiation factor 5A [Cavenderia fasciculata]|uniref:Eukaryotic translation initiation factor 5A n=1 Tax=Cavenderia fasciculata TaxID=261658 RepID=F4PGG2_CACFS|nr:eukaryotic translation initiation factor 5A [Cavenderia fasciculata]EGG24796.1 eukaryotic translation initiation factor 5A [Cavenderia fasciculata]|eukprot:XP_004362647.1 eukaryotic translation initiation factor 5A [Cavenderia fasciculata]
MSDTENDDIPQEDYTNAGSGASLTYPVQCSSLRKNGHVVINNRPCKVVEMSTSKTGKHGHAKVNITGIDIFSGKKYEEICPSTHNIDVPNVSRNEYSVIYITDDSYLSLLKEDGTTKDDLKVPEGEIGENITAAIDAGKDVLVTVISALGEEGVVSYKEKSEK